jgi:hypothetical protein
LSPTRKNLAKDLEQIVHEGLKDIKLPYSKGNSIRLGNAVVRDSKNGYLIYNTQTNSQVARTNFKTSAVAIAKNIDRLQTNASLERILNLDLKLSKHYQDAVFYRHTMATTKDFTKRDATRSRYDLTVAYIRKYKTDLDAFIF